MPVLYWPSPIDVATIEADPPAARFSPRGALKSGWFIESGSVPFQVNIPKTINDRQRMRRSLLIIVLLGLGRDGIIAADKPDESKAVQKIELLHGNVRRDFTLPNEPVVAVDFRMISSSTPEKTNESRFNDKYMFILNGFPCLRSLNLTNTAISDECLKSLTKLESLEKLDLGGTAVTDEGLKELAGLPKLQKLVLFETQITDAGMKHLALMKNLKHLSIGKTAVTDAGLRDLVEMKQLESLDLRHSRTTPAGSATLKRSLPVTKILHTDFFAPVEFDGDEIPARK